MDQPDILAVKLNTRNRKGSGTQPRARPNAQSYIYKGTDLLARGDRPNRSVPSLPRALLGPTGVFRLRRPGLAASPELQRLLPSSGRQVEEGTLP